MKIEKIVTKLNEKGYVYPDCLRWHTGDINLRLSVMDRQDELKLMTEDDKRMLLENFFDAYADDIMEFINQKLEQDLESYTD
jgi:hypothetical protein